MASGRLTGTPKIHFRALKCKSNLALKCHSTDFSVCRTHENSADEGDGYGLWDMSGYTYICTYIGYICVCKGGVRPRPSNAQSVRHLAVGHEFSCTRWQSRWMCNFLRVPITKCQCAWESSWVQFIMQMSSEGSCLFSPTNPVNTPFLTRPAGKWERGRDQNWIKFSTAFTFVEFKEFN